MNHCHRCDCDFEQPGTCNCFAPMRLYNYPVPYYPWAVPVYPIPYYPLPFNPALPYITITWKDGVAQPITILGNDINAGAVTVAPVAPSTGGCGTWVAGNVTQENARGVAWSYTLKAGSYGQEDLMGGGKI